MSVADDSKLIHKHKLDKYSIVDDIPRANLSLSYLKLQKTEKYISVFRSIRTYRKVY